MGYLKRRRSWFVILLAALLVFAGCSGGSGTSGTTNQTGGTGSSGSGSSGGSGSGSGGSQGNADQAKEIKTYRVLFDYNVDTKGMSLTDNEYVDFLQEKTGVRIQIESPGSSGYMEKLNILMASGDYPDAFMVTAGNKNTLMKYGADGMLVDLRPYIDSGKYPNFSKIPEEAWLSVTDEEGHVWGFPYHRHDAYNQVVYINKTWLDALNLQIPRTIEEFYEVMKAFTERDPDGNGQHDTFGLLGNSDLSYGGRIFKAAFDAETYKYVDGELLPPELTEEYKQYLIFMNKLIQENILDPEWPTTNSTIFREKVNTLKYGVFNGFWHFQSNLEFADGVFDHYIAIELPLRPNGEKSKFSFNTLSRHFIGIPITTKDVDGLMAFFDWVLSDEGTRYVYLGIEDFNYTMKDGKPELTGNTRASLHWAFSLVKHGQLTEDVKTYIRTEYADHVVANLELANNMGVLDEIATALPFNPDLAAYNLDSIRDEYTSKSILSREDIHQTWSDYVKRYRSSGGDKAIRFWTDWYHSIQ